jgi:hypothetical protein
MTPEELAAEFSKFATEVSRDMPYEKGRSIAYMTAAYLIRKHLCTPNPLHDAAPDMLAALEEIMDWIISKGPESPEDDDWQHAYDRALAAIAKAKGTPNV